VAPSTGTVSAAEAAVESRVEPRTAEAGARAVALSAAEAPAVAAAAAVAVVAAELTPLVTAPESGAASADAASAAAAGAGSICSARSGGGVGVAVEVGRCGGSNSPEGRQHTGNLSAALAVTLCATRQVLEHRYLPSSGIQTTYECTNSLHWMQTCAKPLPSSDGGPRQATHCIGSCGGGVGMSSKSIELSFPRPFGVDGGVDGGDWTDGGSCEGGGG